MSTGVTFQTEVHPDLKASGDLTSKSIEEFGGTVEDLLMKYQKKIMSKQPILPRLVYYMYLLFVS